MDYIIVSSSGSSDSDVSMKKVAIYVRVSKKEQNYETQKSMCEDYCKRNSLEVFDTYEDKFTGKEFSRPRFDDMLKDMRDGNFNVVMVYKLDRIGRSLPHLLQLFQEFKNRNVDFVSVTQPFDTTTPEGKLMIRLMMLLAEYERELIASRTNDRLNLYKEEMEDQGYYIKKDGTKGYALGRPKGKKDSSEIKRSKTSYYEGWIKRKRKKVLV